MQKLDYSATRVRLAPYRETNGPVHFSCIGYTGPICDAFENLDNWMLAAADQMAVTCEECQRRADKWSVDGLYFGPKTYAEHRVAVALLTNTAKAAKPRSGDSEDMKHVLRTVRAFIKGTLIHPNED